MQLGEVCDDMSTPRAAIRRVKVRAGTDLGEAAIDFVKRILRALCKIDTAPTFL